MVKPGGGAEPPPNVADKQEPEKGLLELRALDPTCVRRRNPPTGDMNPNSNLPRATNTSCYTHCNHLAILFNSLEGRRELI